MKILSVITFIAISLFLTVNVSYPESDVLISPEFVKNEKKIENIFDVGSKQGLGQPDSLEAMVDELERSIIEDWPYLFPNQKPKICSSGVAALKETLKRKDLANELRIKIEKLIKKFEIINELSQHLAVNDFRVSETIYQFEKLAESDKQLKFEIESRYKEAFSKDKLPPFQTMLTQLLIKSPESTFSYVTSVVESKK